MDDTTFLKWLIGLLMAAWTLLFSWTHSRATSAHDKAEEANNKINKCRQEVDTNVHDLSRTLMTEAQVKDFVDRSLKPLEKSIQAVHTDIKILIRGKSD